MKLNILSTIRVSCCMIMAVFCVASVSFGAVNWEIIKTWEVEESPIDIAHSKDGKWIFLLTEPGNVLIYTSDGKVEGKIPVDSSATEMDISRKGDVLYLISRDKKNVQAISIEFIKNINITGSPFLGDAQGEVTIVVFSDFQCSGCGKTASVLDQILEEYPQGLKIVYKNFPLDFHQFAKPAAYGSLAAAEQGKFWEFHDLLFKYSSVLNNNTIDRVATETGLDFERFKKDMASTAVRLKVEQDVDDGKKAGVSSTPTIFINGRRLKDRSMEVIQKHIKDELEK